MRFPREIWWIVGAAVVALVAASLLRTGGNAAKEQALPTATSYSSDPYGLRGLYLTLGRLGYRTQRLRAPLLAPALPERGTLIIADPTPIGEREWSDLRAWVSSGNMLLLAGEGEFLALGQSWPDERESEEPVSYAHPTQPGFLTDGVGAMALRSERRLELAEAPKPVKRKKGGRGHSRDGSEEESPWFSAEGGKGAEALRASAVEVMGDKAGPAVAYCRVGRGQVVLLASAWPLSNEGIRRAGNLRFALNAIGTKGTPVFFDEYHHGYQDQLVLALLPGVAKLAVCQLVLGLLIAAYGMGRRLGPIIPLDRGVRERTEFLQTMTAALQRGRATRYSLRTAYEMARDDLHSRTGLPREAPVEVLVRAVAPGLSGAVGAGARLEAVLTEVERVLAGEGAPSEAQAMALVRRLDEAVAQAKAM